MITRSTEQVSAAAPWQMPEGCKLLYVTTRYLNERADKPLCFNFLCRLGPGGVEVRHRAGKSVIGLMLDLRRLPGRRAEIIGVRETVLHPGSTEMCTEASIELVGSDIEVEVPDA